MAISRQGTPTLKEQTTGTSIVINVPAGVATGEVLVVDIAVAGGTVTLPGGWTQIAAVVNSGADKISALHVVSDAGSEPASYTFSGFTSGRATGIMQRYSGVDGTTPQDVAASTANSASGSTTLDAPSITTVTDGAMLISGGVQDSASGSVTQPGTMSMVSQSAGTGKRSGFADETDAVAGATGVRTWTFNSSTLAHVVWLGALRPSAGAATVALAPAVLALTAQPLIPVPGPLSVALAPAVLPMVAVPLTPVPGAVSVALVPAVLAFSAVAVSPQSASGTVTLAPAVLTLTARPLTPVPGPVTVELVAAVLTLTARPLTPASGPIFVQLAPALLALVAQVLQVSAVPQPTGTPGLLGPAEAAARLGGSASTSGLAGSASATRLGGAASAAGLGSAGSTSTLGGGER